MGGAVLIALGLMAANSCGLVEAVEVRLQDRAIRLGDVVEPGCAALVNAPALGDLVIAELPENTAELSISREGVVALAARRIPGLDLQRGGDAPLSFKRNYTRPQAPHVDCFELRAPARADAPITANLLRSTSCRSGHQPAALRYDRSDGVVRAAANLTEGAYVGRILVAESRFPDTGDALTLAVTVGPVRIERQVWALQPGAHGAAVFVQTEDGDVIRAPVRQGRQEGDRHE